MKRQMEISPLTFKRGQRVEVQKEFLSPIFQGTFGLVECEATNRPGWYYVRGPGGVVDLVPFAAMVYA